MKIIINLILIVLVTQIMVGCGKADTEETSSPEKAAKTDNNAQTTPSAEAVTNDSEKSAETAAQQSDRLVTAPPLKGLEWIKGGPVTFEPGKVYLIEFWATWCAPCKVSIPHLTELQKKYKDKNVIIIGISMENSETVKPYVKSMGDKMDYTVAIDTKGYAQKDYMEAFNKNAIPQAFVINGAGKIVWEGHPLGEMETVLDLVVRGDFDPIAYAKQKAEAAALKQKVMAWYMDYFRKIEADGLTEETKQLASNFIEKAPVEGLNSFAWNILTRVQETNRDLEAALKAAKKANQLTEGKEPSVLDTYALALFVNGQVNEAIEIQQKAVDLAADYPEAQEQLRQTLKKYKAALNKKDS